MKKIVVLGIGNRLMMDDGIGIYLVENLMKDNDFPTIHYVMGESDIDYCIEQIEGATFVIILDAVILGKNPGEVSVIPLSELYEQQSLNLSPHNLHLFHVLYQQRHKTKGYLIGVEPFEITFHIGLSETLESKSPLIESVVKDKIRKLIYINPV